ncbi:hypothetical protein C9J48_10905 [Photobacterium profundum]|uniref:hypothetical protein n=1 Tax=Photobacterium profundum TaxID=74109 RepID=UPI0002D90CA1|nr:hypothetical protein [Photobacterium profundum]PSV62465.1 hypothetical protein C9J48_10905 [Photobacterium profundum]
MPNPEVSFFTDPKVWSVVIAALAVVLSQFPPIYQLIRRGKLELDVYEKAHITHSLGNPNLQFHLILNNVGGRAVTVKSIEAEVKLESEPTNIIKAQNFIKSNESNGQVLLTKFKLKSGEEWAHLTNFFNDFAKSEEKKSKLFSKRARDELTEKFKVKNSTQEMVELEEDLVNEIQSFFDDKFIWQHGEYIINIVVKCTDEKQNISKKFRFTLFESDSDELREYSQKYKYGEGIIFPSKTDVGVVTKLNEINA